MHSRATSNSATRHALDTLKTTDKVGLSPRTSAGKGQASIRKVRAVEEKEHEPDEQPSDDSRSSVPLTSSSSHFLSSVSSAGSQIPIGGGAVRPADAPSPELPAGKSKLALGSIMHKSPRSPLSPATTLSETSSPSYNRSPPSAPSFRLTSIDIPPRDSSRVAGPNGVASLSQSSPLSVAPGRSVLQARQGPMDDAMGDGSVVLASSAGPETQVSGGWDSTVGKAGLGKTGRVINRLVSDNEALKRDIQIERLRAEESRQAARLVEDKMERLVSEFEGRLVEANVTKTLLARKERQVESLQAAVAVERRRALDAQERERVWKEEMDKLRSDTKMQLDEAGMHVALVEGRYNTISFHWRQQGDEVQQAIGAMGQQVAELGDERRLDDERISTLRELCDQQDGNIRELTRQRDAMAEQFESYRREQEQALQAIKATASDREAEQETILAEAREMLDKLKWALSVKEKVPWAE
jgi:hypothetical protein